MAIVKFNVATDMTQFNLATLGGGTVSSFSSTEVDFTSGIFELDMLGKKFGDFDSNNVPHSGLIEDFNLFASGSEIATLSKVKMQVSAFDTFVANHDGSGLEAAILNGNDKITGSGGADVLLGLNGRDEIIGGGGNDKIYGGAGGDSLTGGAGSDTFYYLSVGDSGASGVDTIKDLGAGDHIDLSAIDADTTTAGDQAFHIVSKLKGHAGEMTVTYDSHNDRTIVAMDVDGDGTADSVIWISGDHHNFSGFVL